VSVLAPWRLSHLGLGAPTVGGAFLVSAALEAALSPVLGRIADRRGTASVARASLVASMVVAFAFPWPGSAWLVAGLVVLGGLAFGGFWVPGLAMLSAGADRTGLDQSFAFALMNLAWASGEGLGSLAGGTLGDHFGDPVPYCAAATLCFVTLVAAGLTRAGSLAYSESA